MITVYITNTTYTNTLAIIKAFKLQNKIKLKLISSDINRYPAGRYFVDKFYELKSNTGKSYIDYIKNICLKEKVDIFVPTSLSESILITKNIKFFKLKKIDIPISPLLTLEIFSDKLKQVILFKKYKIPHPETYLSLDKLNKKKTYIIKPRRSSGSINTVVLKGDKVKKIPSGSLVQEFIKGSEFTVDCLVSKQNKLITHVIRERVQILGGQTIVGRTIKDPAISKTVNKIISSFIFRGIINIQVIKKLNRVYVIEVNPRPAMGGLSLSVKSGVNLPLLLVKDSLNMPITKKEKEYKKNLIMTRYLDEYFVNS